MSIDESMERALIRLLLTEVVQGFTSGGHVALTNPRERRGYCSHKRCAPICRRRWQLVEVAGAYLEAHRPSVEHDDPEQLALGLGEGR